MPHARFAYLAIAMATMLPVSNASAAVKRFPPISLATRTPIKHVIIIVMENRTFDNVFNGFPGADSVRTGRMHLGKTVALVPTPFEGNCDPNHYDGRLPIVSWFNPPVIASDHAQATTNYGPDYVAQIADALMTSPAGYWKNTALFVTWDDHGGWYDHVVPPQLDNNGLGFRVPLIAAGAYVKRDYVSHVRHEYGSLLKFIEYNWSLPSLETTDRRADDLLDLFDFSEANAARKPVLIGISHPGATLSFFEHLPFDTKPLDYTPEEK